ncbi:MAG: hypothetical protein U1E35_04995 [Rhodospirillales bacterium]
MTVRECDNANPSPRAGWSSGQDAPARAEGVIRLPLRRQRAAPAALRGSVGVIEDDDDPGPSAA